MDENIASINDDNFEPDGNLNLSLRGANEDKCTKRTTVSAFTFDLRLPASHSYLGQDLEEVTGGAALFSAGEELEVSLFPAMVLMPGQTMPLNMMHPRVVQMFRNIISTQRSTDDSESSGNFELCSIGCLAQVLAFKDETEHELTTLKIRAVGRQRFKILKTMQKIDGSLSAKVKILSEIVLADPLESFHPLSMNRFLKNRRDLKRFEQRYRRTSLFTHHLKFVHQQWSLANIVQKLRYELSDWFQPSLVTEVIERGPTYLSYWVSACFPFDDATKQELLEINTVQLRLCEVLLKLRKHTAFFCRECEVRIAKRSDVLVMNVDGPLATYVNPQGHLHDTLTVSHTEQLETVGRPSTESSWFPGYSWTICQCSHCRAHIGWLFRAEKKHLKPKQFYGITRSAIALKLSSDDTD